MTTVTRIDSTWNKRNVVVSIDDPKNPFDYNTVLDLTLAEAEILRIQLAQQIMKSNVKTLVYCPCCRRPDSVFLDYHITMYEDEPEENKPKPYSCADCGVNFK